jgi:hypothetical protein
MSRIMRSISLPGTRTKGVTRYVIMRSGRLVLCEDDIRFKADCYRRMTKMTIAQLDRQWPGLLDQSIADGLLPADTRSR